MTRDSMITQSPARGAAGDSEEAAGSLPGGAGPGPGPGRRDPRAAQAGLVAPAPALGRPGICCGGSKASGQEISSDVPLAGSPNRPVQDERTGQLRIKDCKSRRCRWRTQGRSPPL
jgi:hypothetical protein